ncbi:MAG TPA: SDR family oxidoreductase [Myxococcaceae bacterium]|nr:SDR family oxidoreductase [Myxococcaceae bacterium]
MQEDPLVIDGVSEEARERLLEAVGRIANPVRTPQARMAKALRRRRQKAEREAKFEHDRELRKSTRIRTLRQAPVFRSDLLLPDGAPPQAEAPEEAAELQTPRRCYVCKEEYRRLHFFYDALCPSCGDLNHAKRFQRAPLEGKVALITGARVKIGYQASLMLLRSGAEVVATTRFPQDAALRYAAEDDFAAWSHRLHIHGLDLRHVPSVERFAQHLESTLGRLDILINNAAQTVRRPPGFYAHLLKGEQVPTRTLPSHLQPLLRSHEQVVASLRPEASTDALVPAWDNADAGLGIHASALLSQIPYTLEPEYLPEVFPEGKLDADLQQVDLREVNSWRLRLGEVSTAEMLEVHLINAVAPFVLCGKLRGLMNRDRSEPRHVVNVSAMEGIFSRGTKTDKHPHTNMAKAALNMMTLTSARDYARDGIYMNAVDTGWVTDEDPAQHADRKREELDFQPPLDIVDGAARVVDPVFAAVNSGEPAWGNFFKDYFPGKW